MLNIEALYKIFEWISIFLNNISFNVELDKLETMNIDKPLDPRWKQNKNGEFQFDFQYPKHENNELYSIENNFYKTNELIECFQICNSEFNLSTDFMETSVSNSNESKNFNFIVKSNNPHIIRDFDEILKLYQQLKYNAYFVEEHERIYEQKNDQLRENEVLNDLVKSYLYYPHLKDEHYRSINKSIFRDFDDDPLYLFHPKIEKIDEMFKMFNIESTRKYPKLKTMTKRTLRDREERRRLLLTSLHLSKDEISSNIESDRITGMLNHLLKF
jgi:hypothetical protein